MKLQSDVTLLPESLGASLRGLQEFMLREFGYCDELSCYQYLPCHIHQGFPRIHASQVSPSSFFSLYEVLHKPVMIMGLATSWRAMFAWRLSELFSGVYRNTSLRCIEGSDGGQLRLKLKYIIPYFQMRHMHYAKTGSSDPLLLNSNSHSQTCATDNPSADVKSNGDSCCQIRGLYDELYVFDPSLGHNLNFQLDYQVPAYFNEDLFAYGGFSNRPPFRWVLMGPAGTGSMVHVDPLGTSAWNTLIEGVKRWVLMPPSTSESWAKDASEERVARPRNSRSALDYFTHVLPKLRTKNNVIEFDQFEGETVFVPSGWWHAVLNLTDTVAVTQNFASSANLKEVWEITCKKQPKFALKWLEGMKLAQNSSSPLVEAIPERYSLSQIVDILQSSPHQPNLKKEKKSVSSLSAGENQSSTEEVIQAPETATTLVELLKLVKKQPSLPQHSLEINRSNTGSSTSDITAGPTTMAAESKEMLETEKQRKRKAALEKWVRTAHGQREIENPALLSLGCGILHAPEVEILLEAKAFPDGGKGRSPLLVAVEAGEADTVKVLCRYGCDLSVKDCCGRDALFLAAEEGEKSVLDFLLDTGKMNVDCTDDEGRTPLIAAAERGRLEVLRSLLLSNANINLRDEDGRTAEQAAMAVGQTNFAKALRTPAAFMHVTETGRCWSCVCGCCVDLKETPA